MKDQAEDKLRWVKFFPASSSKIVSPLVVEVVQNEFLLVFDRLMSENQAYWQADSIGTCQVGPLLELCLQAALNHRFLPLKIKKGIQLTTALMTGRQ